MAPTKEEELKLRNFTGDLSKLGSAERFLKALLDIPFSFKRVDAMLYRANFESEINYLRKSFETLEVCWFTLHSSFYDQWLHMNLYIRHLLSTIACKDVTSMGHLVSIFRLHNCQSAEQSNCFATNSSFTS
jgi:hypothetical protein